MKVKRVAVTATVCAALLGSGSQGVMAEEQSIGAEGMDFAFDNAQVSSVEMSELSGVEMEETEGAWIPQAAGAALGAGWNAYQYFGTVGSDWTWTGLGTAVGTGAVGGAIAATGGLGYGFYGGGIAATGSLAAPNW